MQKSYLVERHLKTRMQYRLLALALWWSGTAGAQSNIRLAGQVSDAESGAPLAAVWVQVEGGSWHASSDENGRYAIENIPPGTYSVRFSLVGYFERQVERVVIAPDLARELSVMLRPRPLVVEEVVVSASTDRGGMTVEGDRVILDEAAIVRFASLGLGALLQQVPGVQIESSGGGSSRSVIRIHGSRSSQVLVLLDGQKMNHPQTGEVDLSEIPLRQVERIEIVRQGNAALFGGGAYAGVISFFTRQARGETSAALRMRGGAFQTAAGEIDAAVSRPAISLNLHLLQDYSRQDFRFERDRQQFRRENAWYRHRSALLKGAYRTGAHEWTLFWQQQRGHSGLPSAFYEEMNHFGAEKEASSRRASLRYRWFLHSRSFVESAISWNAVEQQFDNADDPSPFTRYRVQQNNRVLEIRNQLLFQPHPRLESRLGVQYLQERLDHQNLLFARWSIGRKTRASRAAFGSSAFTVPAPAVAFRSIKLFGALRYEAYFDDPGQWYPHLGLSLTPAPLPEVNISASIGKAVRYPDFNSLFWKGDARARGNPELRPEGKSLWNAAVRWQPRNAFLPTLSVYFYSEKLRNLIYWHRTVNGIWEPRNEDRARKRGWDLSVDQPIIPGRVQVQAAYSHIDAVNLSTAPNLRNRQIVFTPRNTVNASVWAELGGFQTLLIYRWVDERQITPANTGAALPAYELWDASAGYQRQFGHWQTRIGLALKNFTGTQYELIRGFPMPKRVWEVQLEVRYVTN